MSISRQITLLNQTTDGKKIPAGMLGYFRARNRNKLYDLVIAEFQRSGISKKSLAQRLGKEPAQVTRWLGAPGNWTLDTVSDLLFAISGAVTGFHVEHPNDDPKRNNRIAPWVTSTFTLEGPLVVPYRTRTETITRDFKLGSIIADDC